jgi:hypothetical protein
MSYQQNINAGLKHAYAGAPTLSMDISAMRIVVLSDLHRGAGDDADDFRACKETYRAALAHYLQASYILAVLGDAEDLWECWPSEVIAEYGGDFELEKPFVDAGRYWRFYGNHDDLWRVPSEFRRHLGPVLGNVGVLESLRLAVMDGNASLGEVFLVHGHQGTTLGDRLGWLSHWILHNLWRPVQRLTNIRTTTPATDWRLGRRHEIAMYNWAVQETGVVVITGHTHHPIFPSVRGLELLTAAYDDLRHQPEACETEELEQIEADLAFARSQEQPCYINSGCCCFSDGSITGVEIEAGVIRLVRWRVSDRLPMREVLDSAPLKDLLVDVAAGGRPV